MPLQVRKGRPAETFSVKESRESGRKTARPASCSSHTNTLYEEDCSKAAVATTTDAMAAAADQV